MSTESPVAIDYEAIPFLCAIFANLQCLNLLTPRDACTLLRKLCLHSSSGFDSIVGTSGAVRETSAVRVGGFGTDWRCAHSGKTGGARAPDIPRCSSPRHDGQFSSPGAPSMPPCLVCVPTLCYDRDTEKPFLKDLSVHSSLSCAQTGHCAVGHMVAHMM
jgi:hypothetical protein